MADAPKRSDGAIFLLQRLRRMVSEERSFLWNFQPSREVYSQPSPASFFYQHMEKAHKRKVVINYTQHIVTWVKASQRKVLNTTCCNLTHSTILLDLCSRILAITHAFYLPFTQGVFLYANKYLSSVWALFYNNTQDASLCDWHYAISF